MKRVIQRQPTCFCHWFTTSYESLRGSDCPMKSRAKHIKQLPWFTKLTSDWWETTMTRSGTIEVIFLSPQPRERVEKLIENHFLTSDFLASPAPDWPAQDGERPSESQSEWLSESQSERIGPYQSSRANRGGVGSVSYSRQNNSSQSGARWLLKSLSRVWTRPKSWPELKTIGRRLR